MEFGLPPETLKRLRHYFISRPEVKEVRVYGSRALGNYKPGSDIDLAIWSDAPVDISGQIKTELEALSTPYLFDVTDYTYIKHLPLKQHIDQVGKVIYRP
jgi:uncharacterized protein